MSLKACRCGTLLFLLLARPAAAIPPPLDDPLAGEGPQKETLPEEQQPAEPPENSWGPDVESAATAAPATEQPVAPPVQPRPVPQWVPPVLPSALPAAAPRRRHRGRMLAEIEGGFAYQRIYADHVLGGLFDVLLGGDLARVGVGGRFGVRAGQTLAGLPVFVVSLGPEVACHAGRWVRVGAGLDLGGMSVLRVTDNGAFVSFYFALHPDLWVDVDHFGRGSALFLHVRPLIEWFREDNTPSIGAHGLFGVRF